MTTEYAIEELRVSLNEIKGTLKEIESDVKVDIKDLFVSLNAVSRDMQAIIAKMDERDKQSKDNNANIAQTFARFGNSIEELVKNQHKIEMETVKIKYLEKIVYFEVAAIFAMFGWLLQKTLGNLL